MKLTQLDSECEVGPCPTIYATDTDELVVQGFRIDDPEALAAMQLPENETAVRIPVALLRRVARDHLT
ncbi:hypothetical protein C7C46_18390 [Streptomyces tateyamensis]|uniref:Uncharacterized protein n=1 Tax=Streptomyces tateyamensis TaxID=565073 RepID=A0A2V4P0I5_9ACTN|nr:hypothetical protein [Streptomyces tateyamensis]PYC77645.1 hypothetical protein C7C46_18390 [Streptomyces tateyamensis]